MDALIQQLEERARLLEKVIRMIEQNLKGMPEGRLRVTGNIQSPQFYQILESEASRERKYLKASEKELVQKLSQKDYLVEMLHTSRRELKHIQSFLKHKSLMSSNYVFDNLHDIRKNLVRPILVDDDTYAELWLRQPYTPNPSFPEHLVHATKRGEMVRSKGEAMIADMYYEQDIPYLYDFPVKLFNGKVKYIDFAVLHKVTRKVFYHEHLGLLDKPTYFNDNMEKLLLYRKSGIFVGKNLILTHETEDQPLDMNVLRKNTRELFGC